jgi:small subunit ribosomal protein S8
LGYAEYVSGRWQTREKSPVLKNQAGNFKKMDPISDLLNRIRNGQAVLKEKIEIPFSNIKYEIAKILASKGFVAEVDKRGRKGKKVIEITLKYEDKMPAISGLKRISKPGQRIYAGAGGIKVRGLGGIIVISTSEGLMTDKEAKKKGLGGELVCEIW